MKEFPNFILGGAYLIGRPAIPRLLAAAQVTPVLLLEDVYVTGLCAVGGKVELVSNKRYYIFCFSHFENYILKYCITFYSLYEEDIGEELEVCTFEDHGSWRATGAADVTQTWNFAQAMKKSGEICVKTNKCARMFMGLCIPAS